MIRSAYVNNANKNRRQSLGATEREADPVDTTFDNTRTFNSTTKYLHLSCQRVHPNSVI